MNESIYEREKNRLVAALGMHVTGGVIENIQPIGSSSVPALAGSGSVDIVVAAWPYPVDAPALDGLGYRFTGEFTPDIQRYEDTGGQVQLWLSSAESGFLEQAVLIRDYLRSVEATRQDFAANRPVTPAEKEAFFERILPEARRWWVAQHGFAPLEEVAAEFSDAAFSWFISSGWALDLFLGRVTRVHRDVDVVVPFSQQSAMQEHLLERGWQLITPLNGRLEPWPRHMQLQLPRHQVHARRGEAFIDLLLTDIAHGVWRYRRNPIVLRSAERIGLTSSGGIPYLAPELVLLFKSRNTSRGERPQDQPDFEQALPLLEPERRAWLRWAITASDPDNPWLKVI